MFPLFTGIVPTTTPNWDDYAGTGSPTESPFQLGSTTWLPQTTFTTGQLSNIIEFNKAINLCNIIGLNTVHMIYKWNSET